MRRCLRRVRRHCALSKGGGHSKLTLDSLDNSNLNLAFRFFHVSCLFTGSYENYCNFILLLPDEMSAEKPARISPIKGDASPMKPERPKTCPPATAKRCGSSAFYGTTTMLSLFLLLLFGIPQTVLADCEVTFRWDANSSAPEGYQLYGREEGQYYDDNDPWWQGDSTFTQCTIGGLSENKIYFFVVRAFMGDHLSGDSNEVRYACGDNIDVSTPGGGSGSGCFIQLIFLN